jgi:hypothetical protein
MATLLEYLGLNSPEEFHKREERFRAIEDGLSMTDLCPPTAAAYGAFCEMLSLRDDMWLHIDGLKEKKASPIGIEAVKGIIVGVETRLDDAAKAVMDCKCSQRQFGAEVKAAGRLI